MVQFRALGPDHCQLTLVGEIDTEDGATIHFDSRGFALPPKLYFSGCPNWQKAVERTRIRSPNWAGRMSSWNLRTCKGWRIYRATRLGCRRSLSMVGIRSERMNMWQSLAMRAGSIGQPTAWRAPQTSANCDRRCALRSTTLTNEKRLMIMNLSDTQMEISDVVSRPAAWLTLEPLFDAELRYTSDSPADAVVPPEGREGVYIGSGDGLVNGVLNGTIRWSFYSADCMYLLVKRGDAVPPGQHLCYDNPGGFIDTHSTLR